MGVQLWRYIRVAVQSASPEEEIEPADESEIDHWTRVLAGGGNHNPEPGKVCHSTTLLSALGLPPAGRGARAALALGWIRRVIFQSDWSSARGHLVTR